MTKLVYIVTVPLTAKAFLVGHLSYMRHQGFDVTLISSPDPELQQVGEREGVQVVGVPMQREISLWRDMVTLRKLYMILHALKPDIVNASTPKAGLLGMLAACLAGVPVRVYLLRGLRAETLSGLKRSIVNSTEWLASACAHHVVCVSASLGNVYAKRTLAPARKLKVLGAGSSNGVRAERFQVNDSTAHAAALLRQQLAIPEEALVIGFMGRYTRDKGIVELVNAFDLVLEVFPDARLLLIGRFEAGDPIPDNVVARINAHPQLIQVGFVADSAPYYHLMDLLAFPSYREGFPNVPLEAALAQVPVVGFQATGTVDAVQDGKTGILVPLGTTHELAEAIIALLRDPEYRHCLGMAAKERALREFQPQCIWGAWAQLYREALPLNVPR